MALKSKNRGRSCVADRELAKMAETLDLDAIVKRTSRKPEAILKSAMRLSISIKGRKAKGK